MFTSLSSSHPEGFWSTDDTVTMTWSGAVDPFPGSGVAEYRYVFDFSATTDPDANSPTEWHTSDPHSVTSGSFPDTLLAYFHLSACDAVGNCSVPIDKGPYRIDSNAPTDPTVTLPNQPTDGSWSDNNWVRVEWSGATDPPGGSGVDGYSYHFDHQPVSQPDTTIDQAHIDGTIAKNEYPGDGVWYLHMSTVDKAGNWTSTVHEGPIKIDTEPPSLPGSLVTTSHDPPSPSDYTIDMAWASASDAGSGLGGYSYSFSTSATPNCNGQTLDAAATSVSSWPLPNASIYFHICAIDVVGNWSAIATGGPYLIAAFSDLAITLSDSPDPVLPGESLTLTATVTNNGPSTAVNSYAYVNLPNDVTHVMNTQDGCG